MEQEETGHRLIVRQVVAKDAAAYSCKATNVAGTATASAKLIVKGQPLSQLLFVHVLTNAGWQHVCTLQSSPSHKAHRAALISVSLALSQTPAYTARTRIRG